MHSAMILLLLAVTGSLALDGVAIESSQVELGEREPFFFSTWTLTLTTTVSSATTVTTDTTCLSYSAGAAACGTRRRRAILIGEEEEEFVAPAPVSE